MRVAAILAVALAGALPVAGCRQRPGQAPPRAKVALVTTDGAIALGNLDVQIAAEERRLASSPHAVPVLANLVDLLLTRARVIGQVADVDRAGALAERAAVAPGRDPRGPLARAATRVALHQFASALADLDEAERRGADPVASSAQRASILQAQGRLDEALRLRAANADARPDLATLGALAVAEAARGDLASAERHFEEALLRYRDTSPVPVAWIEFQWGIACDAAGRLDDAAVWYRAALARLPRYAEAAGHLAAVEHVRHRPDRAEALLRPLVGPRLDPQYATQLAALVEERGERDAAERLRADARTRYEALLARHPEAYADHAARAFLRTDPHRALELARTNLRSRQTWDAFDLALQAARVAGADEAGCRVAREAMARPAPPPRIAFAAGQALRRCGGGTVTQGWTGG